MCQPEGLVRLRGFGVWAGGWGLWLAERCGRSRVGGVEPSCLPCPHPLKALFQAQKQPCQASQV